MKSSVPQNGAPNEWTTVRDFAGQHHNLRAGGMHDKLFAIAMYLLPFSFGEDTVVISYSLPFFALLCIYYFVKIARTPVRIDRSVAIILIISVFSLAVMTVSSFIGDNTLKALSRVAIHANGVAILFYFCTSLSTARADEAEARYYFLARVFVTSGAVMSLYYLTNFLINAQEHGLDTVIAQRYVGGYSSLPWGASNAIAAALLLPLITAFQLLAEPPTVHSNKSALKAARRQRVRDLLAATLITVAIFSTLSRNAIAMSFLLLLFFGLRLSKRAIALVIVVAVLATIIVNLDNDIVAQLYDQRLRDRDELLSGNTRIYLWGLYLEYIKENPFTPIGYYASLGVFEMSSHNFSITTYVEQSLVGWLLAVALATTLIYKALQMTKLPRSNASVQGQFMIVGMLLISINLHFEDANFTHQYITYFWVFVSIFCFRFSILQNDLKLVRMGSPR